jgi:hypothetical protein
MIQVKVAPTKDVPNVARWEFMASDTDRGSWTWRRMAGNRTILEASRALLSMEKAISDATEHGFSANGEHWVVKFS